MENEERSSWRMLFRSWIRQLRIEQDVSLHEMANIIGSGIAEQSLAH